MDCRLRSIDCPIPVPDGRRRRHPTTRWWRMEWRWPDIAARCASRTTTFRRLRIPTCTSAVGVARMFRPSSCSRRSTRGPRASPASAAAPRPARRSIHPGAGPTSHEQPHPRRGLCSALVWRCSRCSWPRSALRRRLVLPHRGERFVWAAEQPPQRHVKQHSSPALQM